ncbi:MAG: trehalose-6-phosphate synthase, partial [Deltaproteobacteria bacterium]
MSWTSQRLQTVAQETLQGARFVVVANREPFSHVFRNGEICCQQPASGLTTALDPVMRTCGGVWVAHGSGDADREVVDERDRVAVPPDSPSYTLRRVWLSKEEENG